MRDASDVECYVDNFNFFVLPTFVDERYAAKDCARIKHLQNRRGLDWRWGLALCIKLDAGSKAAPPGDADQAFIRYGGGGNPIDNPDKRCADACFKYDRD